MKVVKILYLYSTTPKGVKLGQLLAKRLQVDGAIIESYPATAATQVMIVEFLTQYDIIIFDGTIENEIHDTTYVVQHDTLYKGFTKEFNFNNEYRTLEGLVKYQQDTLGVNITKDIVNFNYNVAMDKNNRIYVTSTNPYVKYNEITGFTVPKQKKKHFSIGPSVNFGYDPINNKAAFTIGGSVIYNLYQF